MGKRAKEHRKKVAKRNRIIAQERKRYEKITKELFEQFKNSKESFDSIDTALGENPLSGPLNLPTMVELPNPTIQVGPQI
jgi:hypothetical protein